MKLLLPKTFLKFLFLCVLFSSSLSGWSQTYNQITTTGGLVDGDYLIVGDSTNDGMMINTTAATPYINYSAVSNPGATITTGYTAGNVFQVTVTGTVITIYNASVGYVSWGRTGNNTGNTADFYVGTVANTEKWTATVASGLWTLSNVGTPGRLLQWNSSSPRFACYTSAQIKLKLYKKAVTAPTVTTVAATSIGTAGATLNGTVNANGFSTTTSFDYGTTIGYGSTATATPSPVTGTTATAVSATVGSLALNTQYHYRAVGVAGSTVNGSDMTFYTLAATPGVLVVSNPLQTTLDVTVDATTENSNPSTTQYAIQENGGQYVQGDGTLGATAVWQTAAAWGTKTVTGLSTSTTYTFKAKARNGANVETVFGGTASGTTLAPQTVDVAFIQYPTTIQNISEGGSLTVYTRAYEPGLTTLSGSQPNLFAWVGYSSTNDNPANAGWTWVASTFNVDAGNDDEYQATLTGLPIGTYYYAARFQIGTGPYVYGGSAGVWNNDSVTLHVNADVVDYVNVQFSGSSTLTQGGTKTVLAQVYEPGITPGAGAGAGITAEIGYSTSNSTPDGTWTWTTATYNGEVGNNDEYAVTLGAGFVPGTYYFASRFIKTGSSTYVYGGSGGVWNSDNLVLTVVADVVDFCNIQYPATGTITQGMGYDVYAQVYELGVTEAAGQGGGITAEIGYSTSNTTPDGTWTWVSASYHADGIGGDVNNDEYKVTFSGLAPGTYYYASRFIKTGSTTYVYGGTNGSPWTTSGVLTVNGLGSPTAAEGTSVGSTSFTANWEAVTDATSYEIDVYEQTNTPATTIVETFTNIGGGTTSSYNTRSWTGVGSIDWTAYKARTDQEITSGNETITLRDQAGAYLESGVISGGLSNIQFDVQQFFGGSGGVLTIKVLTGATFSTETVIGTKAYSATASSYDSGVISGITGDYKILIENNTNARAGIDNLSFTGLAGSTTTYVLQDFNVGDVTSHVVTMLNPETAYHYVVRAVLGAVTSGNSNVIDVTTGVGACTWNGTAWSNVTGPTDSISAIIEGAYDTTTYGGFTAKDVTVNSGSLTVNTGTTVTIINGLTNTLTAADVVVENNGNLIQEGLTNQNTGAITVKRHSSALMRQDYTLWSSPVAGQQLQSFSPMTLSNRFYTYNTTGNVLSAISSPSTTDFATAHGCLIRMPNNHPATATVWTAGAFVGVPNSGDYTFTMADGGAGNRFNLVGNPYPSPIDAADFVGNATNAANITGTLYFWRKTNNAASPTYCTWTTGGFVSNGEAQVYDPNDVIQTGQGFFVEATGNGSSLVFNNTMRTDDHANQFFRTASTVERHRIWLNATGANGLFSQAMVGYMTNASNAFDATIDGKYINDGAIALTSLIENEASVYAIQGRSLPFDSNDVVPMQFKANAAGTYSIAIDHVDGLFSGEQNIYLRDALTGVDHDLKSGAYSFTTEAGTFANRFSVVYTQALSVENPTMDANAVVVYKNANQSFTVNSGSVTMSSINVFDIRGRLLTTQTGINANETIVSAGQANEVLLIQVTSIDGAVVTKKVVR
jgi:hypothetical protein